MIKTILFFMTSMLFLASIAMALASDNKPDVSISDAISIAKGQVPGRVIRAKWEKGIYEVRIRTGDGENKTLFIDDAKGSVLYRDIISVDDAVGIATGEVPGRVIKVEFEKGLYEVKIRTKDGNKVEVKVDSAGGKVLGK